MHKKGEIKYLLLLLLLQCFDIIIKQHILKSGVSSFRVTGKSRNNYQLFHSISRLKKLNQRQPKLTDCILWSRCAYFVMDTTS